MVLVPGIVFILMGLVMVITPKLFFVITQSWKNDSDTKPSSMFKFSTRIGGVIFFAVGIAALAVQFL
jgi:hypothetical protein